MTMTISDRAATAMVSALGADIDHAGTPGQLLLYSDPRPSAGGTPSGPLQAAITLNYPCASAASRVLTFVDGLEDVRMDDLTITWGRFVDGTGAYVIDVTVSDTAGSGVEVVIDNVDGFIGGYVRLDSGVMGY